MNLELTEALDQFRGWQESECRVLFTRSEHDEIESLLCRVVAVGEDSILLAAGEMDLKTVSNLREADFKYSDVREARVPGVAALHFVCAIDANWPTGKSCRFLEVLEGLDLAAV